MKITGIISSPRKNGSGAYLIRKALKKAEALGAEIKEIFLAEKNIKFCRGCFHCMAKGSCSIQDDDFEEIKKEIESSDGIILCSPNYAFSANANMKRLFERFGMMEYMTSGSFGGKYIACIGTAGGAGAKKVAKKMAALFTNGILRRAYESSCLGINTGKTEAKNNPDEAVKAEQLGEKLFRDIEKGNKYPFQNIFKRIVNSIFIKPKFLKMIIIQKEGSMKGVYEYLKGTEILV
jgi:multimeric flavodoxin WrbA